VKELRKIKLTDCGWKMVGRGAPHNTISRDIIVIGHIAERNPERGDDQTRDEEA
jgi:hypothetical protein